MANELTLALGQTGQTVVAQFYLRGVLNGSTTTMVEQVGAGGLYVGTMPAIAAGLYQIMYYIGTTLRASGEIDWDGTNESTVGSRLSTSSYTPPDNADIASLRADLTTARAGNLDNLNATVASRSTYAGGPVASVTAPVTVGTNNDKTGYGLSVAAIQSIWDALTSALTTPNSVGKRLVDFVGSLTYTAPDNTTIASIATGVASLITTVSAVPSAVWAFVSRTLTTPPLDSTQTSQAVQTALDSQGYSSTRAGYLDVLNGIVAAVQSGLGTLANQSTILGRIGSITGTGSNTILGFFKAALSKSAGVPSDIGGTFDPATDSNEAISEAVAASSGSSDVSSFSGSAAVIIDAIKAMTDKFSLPGVIFAPFFGGGDSSIKTIWRWRDYLTTNGQSIDYQILGLASTDIVTWTIVAGGQETTKTMVYVEADIPLARLELTRAETGALVRGDWDYEIFVANSLGDKAEKYFGTIRVRDVLKK